MMIISIAAVGILSVMSYTTGHGADPMIRSQMVAVGQSYLEEITLKYFADPDDANVCAAAEAGGRTVYDNICDYDGLADASARDSADTAISGLANYSVAVDVDCDQALDDIPGNAICNSSNALRVRVRVTHPSAPDIALVAYRARF